MSGDAIHRAINLAAIVVLMFMWSMSVVRNRRNFSRRQMSVSIALLPLFYVIGHGTWRAWQNHAPVTLDTWSMSFALGIVLGALVAPKNWYRDRS